MLRWGVRYAWLMLAPMILSTSSIAEEPAAPAARLPPVTVAKPVSKVVRDWDEYSGHFEAVQTVEIRARVSGFVDAIHFKDGQFVEAGDPLFTIDPRPFEIAVESARAEIARAEAQVTLAASEVKRATPLLRSSAISEREFTQRNANLSVSEAQLQVAKAALKEAELNLAWTIVKAPIKGRISDRKIDIGNLIVGGNSGTNTLLTTIVSLDPIHFVFDLSESDYLRFVRLAKPGQRQASRGVDLPVRLRLADELDYVHEGKVDFLDNRLNPRSGTLRGRAVFANANELFSPGTFARLRLYADEREVLLVPDSAIVSDQMQKLVLVVGDGDVIRAAPVELGKISDGMRIVLSGLTTADDVVIDSLANPMVRPGIKVAPQPAASEVGQ